VGDRTLNVYNDSNTLLAAGLLVVENPVNS